MVKAVTRKSKPAKKHKRAVIPPGVKSLLWLQAGGRCEFEGCNEPLWKDGLTTLPMNASQIGHIVSDSPDGPRGNATDSPRLAKDISNLMLLCTTHHKLVDSKIHEARFPREMLEHMKEVHERRVELMTSIHGDKRTQVVSYWANIGKKRHFMSDQVLLNAVLPDYYPTSSRPLEFASANSVLTDDDGGTYWEVEKLQLDRQFQSLFREGLGKTSSHISIFAVAPQPLLVYLGSLVSEMVPTEVYQLHREPQDWKWKLHEEGIFPMPRILRSGNPAGEPCLLMAISASIEPERVEQVLGADLDIWTITVDAPHNDVLQSREQLIRFRKVAREALDRLSQEHPEAEAIHLFPVAPVAACVELGRVIQPRAIRPIRVYNQTSPKAGFKFAMLINNHEGGGQVQ